MPQTSGLINARGAKPPRPPPSPKGFVWPAKKAFTRELYERYAASLQELLAQRKQTHVDLGKTLWGVSKIGACRSTKARSWILAQGAVPDADEAAYVADLLDVPMARLLNPESAFSPHPKMYKPRGMAKHARATTAKEAAAPKKKRPYNKRQQNNGAGNGTEVHDPRWTLADDVPRPVMRLQTSPLRPSWVVVTLTAELPLDVAMSLVHLVHENKPGPAAQVLMGPLGPVFATEVPPLIEAPTQQRPPQPLIEAPQPPQVPGGSTS